MNGLSNAHHFRKTVAGWCMVLAPLALLAAMIDNSLIGTTEDAYVIGKVGDPDTGDFAQMALVLGLVLMVPATLGLMHMLREREVAFGHVGGAIALLGLLVLPWAFMLGIILLAFGLYRARVVQPMFLMCLTAGAVVVGAAAAAESEFLGFVGAAALLVGMGAIGRMVLSESDADWEHTPVLEGFRPVAGMR